MLTQLTLSIPFLIIVMQIAKNSPVWNVLAKKNQLDVQLYEYIEQVFKDQQKIVKAYEERNLKLMPFWGNVN